MDSGKLSSHLSALGADSHWVVTIVYVQPKQVRKRSAGGFNNDVNGYQAMSVLPLCPRPPPTSSVVNGSRPRRWSEPTSSTRPNSQLLDLHCMFFSDNAQNDLGIQLSQLHISLYGERHCSIRKTALEYCRPQTPPLQVTCLILPIQLSSGDL